MQTSIKRRFLAYALAVAVLIGASAYQPQKADAIALTATASVVALVASVMTACGVTYWAATQTDAVNYLGDKITQYIATTSSPNDTPMEWLGVSSIAEAFTILIGGKLSVGAQVVNKILAFARWLISSENIQSGGQQVGILSELVLLSTEGKTLFQNSQFLLQAKSDDSEVYAFFLGSGEADTKPILYAITLGDNKSVEWSTSTVPSWHSGGLTTSGQYNGVNYKYRQLFSYKLTNDYSPSYDTMEAAVSDIINGSTVTITPTETVSVPNDVETGESIVITTNASISNSDTNEEACQAILDTVVSQDGLSSTSTTEGAGAPSGWTWLSDILADIKGGLDDIWLEISSLPLAIGNAIGSAIQNVVSGISTTVSNILTFLQNTITGIGQKVDDVKGAILGLPSSIASAISSVLSSAFVPSQAYVATFVASLYSTFDNHFSILSYPFSLLGTFITKVGTIGSSDPIFTWGNIYEPFSGKLLIAAGSYNLNTALQNQAFANAHSIYMIIIKGLLSFQFVSFLYAWFCDVFHMKNSDFDSPFDEDGEEE